MTKEFFLEVQQRIADTVTEVKHIDENWGQLEFFDPHPPVQFPCVLIDIGQVTWSNKAMAQQLGEGEIVVTIANMKITNTSQRAPQPQKDNAWAILDILKSVHLALHNWKPGHGESKLIRTGTQRVLRDNGVQEYRVSYKFLIKDDFVPLYTNPSTTPTPIIQPL